MTQKPRDVVDAAIDKTEQPKEPDSFVTELVFPDGSQARLIVPFTFDSDKFESCVGALMQLRVLAEQRKAQRADGLVLPDKPHLVVPS